MRPERGVQAVLWLMAIGAVAVAVRGWAVHSRPEFDPQPVISAQSHERLGREETGSQFGQEASAGGQAGFQGREPAGTPAQPSQLAHGERMDSELQKPQEMTRPAEEGGGTYSVQADSGDSAAADSASELSGEVTAVDPVAHTLAIQRQDPQGSEQPMDAQAPQRVTVGIDAAIMHGDRQLSFWDLRVGDQVQVSMQNDASVPTASRVVVYHRAGPG